MTESERRGPPEPKKRKFTEDQKPVECEECEEIFLTDDKDVTLCPYCCEFNIVF